MKKTLSLIAFALMVGTLLGQAVAVRPAPKKTIRKLFTGIWELVSVQSIAADGTVSHPYGEHPVGNMILTKEGYYSLEIYKAERAKIASGNKTTATPEENAMLVKGSNAHFGTFAVDLPKQIIIFKVKHAFFPNWEGQDLQQSYTLVDGTLTYSSTSSTFGASKAIVIWKKR